MIPWPPPIEYWRPLVESVAIRYEMDPALIAAVIWHESRGDPAAIRYEPWADVESIGLMQVVDFPWRGITAMQLRNPEFNVRYGTGILALVLDQEDGNTRRALALYNCGFAGVAADRCGKWGGYHYAAAVLNTCREFGGCLPRPVERRR